MIMRNEFLSTPPLLPCHRYRLESCCGTSIKNHLEETEMYSYLEERGPTRLEGPSLISPNVTSHNQECLIKKQVH